MTHDYTFKSYIANGREYYEYSTDALAKNSATGWKNAVDPPP